MKNEEFYIEVYTDWESLEIPHLMGVLSVQRVRGKEIFSFEYAKSWLQSTDQYLFLDPNLELYSGRQFLDDEKVNFGLFMDSSPDRWGRLLMRRREALEAKFENRSERQLLESDFLLGVYDGHRLGGLRFKLNASGPFLNDNKDRATPPWSSLRELEYASLQFEQMDRDSTEDPDYDKWLSVLIDPGSSLGGTRPKASVIDEEGALWIAKFPSAKDESDSGLWEMVLNQLAISCGIDVPVAKLKKFNSNSHTYLSKRFDRTQDNKRIHFSSAMTLLGLQDGASFNDGNSYLDLVGFISKYSIAASSDLEQLWRRISFNVFVSNTDDHLRNHGFVLTNQGWRLSPAYDMNPNPYGNGLTLNINQTSNDQDISLVLSVAPLFKLNTRQARDIITQMKQEITAWHPLAKSLGASQGELERMKRAFRLVDAQ